MRICLALEGVCAHCSWRRQSSPRSLLSHHSFSNVHHRTCRSPQRQRQACSFYIPPQNIRHVCCAEAGDADRETRVEQTVQDLSMGVCHILCLLPLLMLRCSNVYDALCIIEPRWASEEADAAKLHHWLEPVWSYGALSGWLSSFYLIHAPLGPLISDSGCPDQDQEWSRPHAYVSTIMPRGHLRLVRHEHRWTKYLGMPMQDRQEPEQRFENISAPP